MNLLRYSATTSTIHLAREDVYAARGIAHCQASVRHRAGGNLDRAKFCRRCIHPNILAIARSIGAAFFWGRR